RRFERRQDQAKDHRNGPGCSRASLGTVGGQSLIGARMKKLLIGICVALLLTGCGSKGSSSKAGVEDQSLSEQNKTDAQKAADAQSKADAAARQAAEDKRKQDEARKAADQAVVKPLPETSMSAKPLTDVASMLKDPGSPLAKRSVYYDFDMY